MRLTGRIVGVILGLVAALYISGCRTALEPYTPAGADTLWQPEPVPDLFDDAATVVTDVAIENHADAAVIVLRTSGAPPQVRAHQRYEPTHVALDIQAARLGMQQQPLALQDPGGTVIKVVAVERIRNMQPQVTVRVHVHETVPFEVEQAEGVIRLALAHRRPDTGAAESPAPAPEADAEPVTPGTAAESPAAEAAAASMTDEAAAQPALPEAVVEFPEAAASAEPSPSESADAPDEPSSAPSGETISLDVQEADLHDVLRLIADVMEVNIIAGADVQGSVTTRLENVPWEEALDAVLSIHGMGHERSRQRHPRGAAGALRQDARGKVAGARGAAADAADFHPGNHHQLRQRRPVAAEPGKAPQRQRLAGRRYAHQYDHR